MTEEGLLSSFFFNKNEDNKSDYIFSNNSKTEKTLLILYILEVLIFNI